MKLSEDNINSLPISPRNKLLLQALLEDLEEINNNLPSGMSELYINWIENYTQYSPERVDPCPDYYGMYQIKREDEILGIEMDINDLDTSLCLLHNFLIKE